MSDAAIERVLSGLFIVALITLGIWLGAASYNHDGFDCTRACAGAHSIEYNKKCYCEEKP